MKKIFAVFALVLVLFSSSALAADCSNPKNYISSLTGDVLKIIQSKSTDAAKTEQLTQIFKRQVSTAWMGKFVLGKNWRTLTPDQQRKYLEKYTDYLIASYVPIFRKYSGEKINVTDMKTLENGESEVKTVITGGKSDVIVNYRLKPQGGCYKVTDIIPEGISLINTQRQDFGSVFSQKGYDGLIESLDRKILASAK